MSSTYCTKREGKLNVLDVIVLIITVVTSVLLALSYLAPYVNPIEGWPIAVLGLVSPILYLATMALALYWVLRWKKYMILPLVALALGLGRVPLFFQPSLKKHYSETEAPKSDLRVMTYNVEGFMNHGTDNKAHPTMDSIGQFIAGMEPDILCMQEFQITRRMPHALIDSLLHATPYHEEHFSIYNRAKKDQGLGVAVYSRFPMINKQVLLFENSSNCAMSVDVIRGRGDTLRVINCHLQTTAITYADRSFMDPNQFISSDMDDRTRKAKNILRKLRNNYRMRSVQADSIAARVAASPYPVVVCGDFNDTPMSYVYHTVRGPLRDAFVEKGQGTSNTYRGFFNLFRIDYILHDPSLEAVSYLTPDISISDHKPVVAGFTIKR